MSFSSAPSSILPDVRAAASTPVRVAEPMLSWCTDQVARVLFWAAIALPVCYLALLARGIATTHELFAFLELFGLHVLALVGGRFHE